MLLEGRTIIMRNEPPPMPLRAGFGGVGLVFSAIVMFMACNVVREIIRETSTGVSLPGVALSMALVTLFGGAAILCLHVALRPARELRIDPENHEVTFTVSGPFGEKCRRFDQHLLEQPHMAFAPEIGENPARYSVVINLPDGKRMEYHDPTLSLDDQKTFAEQWCDRISAVLR